MSQYGSPPPDPTPGQEPPPDAGYSQTYGQSYPVPPPPPPPSYGYPPQGYGQSQPYGQAPYGQAPYGQAPYGQAPYGQPGYGQPAYGFGGYASWGDRVVGTLWDVVYLWPALVAFVVAALLVGIGAGLNGSAGGGILIALGGLGYLGALGFLVWRYVKNTILDQGRTGYTYGKRKVGIRVVSEATGQAPGVGSCVGRYFLHSIIATFLYIDYLWPLWDDKSQTLTDKVLTTVVVKQPSS